jgi:hypothetical protein
MDITNKTARAIDTNRLIHSLSQAPHTIYVEAMRRKTALLDGYHSQPRARQPKVLADCDQLTLVIRAFYANHEGGRKAA